MVKNKNRNIVVFLLIFVLTLLSFASESYCKGLIIKPKLNITDEGLDFHGTTGFESLENNNSEVTNINTLLSEYRFMIGFGSAIALLTLIAIFIINLMKLGNSRGNPQARQKALMGLLITGISIALLGSLTLIVSLSYQFIG